MDLQLNFKTFLVLIFIFVSCGLKTNPKAPPGTNLPTIQDEYSYQAKPSSSEQKDEEENKKKNPQKAPKQ